jgi:putative DeoR family transcriptional regulator (stage III sporulation protein D)
VKDYIEERALEIGKYIISSKCTVRDASRVFGISKSTIHKDVTGRLPRINPNVAMQVREVIDTNTAERHIRGGMATAMKFAKIF